jgi:hypothetical protein
MRFLVDASSDARLVVHLRQLGHDATRIGTDYPRRSAMMRFWMWPSENCALPPRGVLESPEETWSSPGRVQTLMEELVACTYPPSTCRRRPVCILTQSGASTAVCRRRVDGRGGLETEPPRGTAARERRVPAPWRARGAGTRGKRPLGAREIARYASLSTVFCSPRTARAAPRALLPSSSVCPSGVPKTTEKP